MAKHQRIEKWRAAMRDIPRMPLEVYTSNSYRRVGVEGDYIVVMSPIVTRDGHLDLHGEPVLQAMVAAFNAMLEIDDHG